MLMQMALNDWSNLENTDLEIRWKGTGKMIQDIEHWDLPWPYISQSERLASLLTLQLVASSISDQSNVCVCVCVRVCVCTRARARSPLNNRTQAVTFSLLTCAGS